MQVKTDGRLCLEAPAAAEAIEDLLFHDYYTRTPRLRLTGEAALDGQSEVLLDRNDVSRLVECAIRHPSLNMRHAVLTAIWNHPESFREIFRFGLQAAEAFAEIRKIVADELGKGAVPAAVPTPQAGETLLPKLPLPAHLRGRGRE
jgi:hypothetical protein